MEHYQTIEMPEFARDVLRKQACSFCEEPYADRNVTAAGIRRGKDGKTYYWYEMECFKCKHRSQSLLTSRPMDVHELGHAIGEMSYESPPEVPASEAKTAMNSQPPDVGEPQAAKSDTRGRISQEEVERFRRKLNSDSYDHRQFMYDIGITPKDLRRYTGDGKDEKGK